MQRENLMQKLMETIGTQSLSEMQVSLLKYRLISAIIEDTDESRVLEVERLYNQSSYLYSDDEMRKNVMQHKKDYDDEIIISEEHKQIVRERIKKYENSSNNYLSWNDIELKMVAQK